MVINSTSLAVNSQAIRGTPDAATAGVQNVHVDHLGFDAGMPEQFLHRADNVQRNLPAMNNRRPINTPAF